MQFQFDSKTQDKLNTSMTKFMLAEDTKMFYIHKVSESLNHFEICVHTNAQTVTDISQIRGI